MKKKILLFFVFILIFALGAGYFWFHGIVNKIFISRSNGASAASNSIQQYLDSKTPFNIVLLGYGGGNHDGADLTDSIMVVHIDPKTQKIFLISIPRDIWIKIPTNGTDGGYWKINAAYELGLDDTNYPNKQQQFKGANGGGRLAEYMISQVTGLPIEHFVGMDFFGFKHTIDTLGGVDIKVQPAFTDYSYPIDGKEDATCGFSQKQIASLSATIAIGNTTESQAFPCRFETLHFNSGMQHMDGERALSYVRSRHSEVDGTDFGRAGRQRNLLVAVKQKVFSAGFIPRIITFMSSLSNDLRTDLSFSDVKTFIANVNTLNKYSITTLALTDQNYLKDAVSNDGQDILEPKSGLGNWGEVHNYIASELNGNGETIMPIVEVENGTTIPGLASVAVNRLENNNIQTLAPIDAPVQKVLDTSITIYNKNIDKDTINSLKKEFGVSDVLYTNTSQTEYNILVVVGQNYNQKEGKKLLNEP